MAQLLQPVAETTDPRILRSRRMLMDALARLLMKKEFEDVSVQEIADEATLNRATFYHIQNLLDGIPLPQSDRAPSHNVYRLQRSIARHCTRRVRLSCGEYRLSHSVVADGARRLDHSYR